MSQEDMAAVIARCIELQDWADEHTVEEVIASDMPIEIKDYKLRFEPLPYFAAPIQVDCIGCLHTFYFAPDDLDELVFDGNDVLDFVCIDCVEDTERHTPS